MGNPLTAVSNCAVTQTGVFKIWWVIIVNITKIQIFFSLKFLA